MSYIQADLGMPPNFKSALYLNFVQKGGGGVRSRSKSFATQYVRNTDI